MSDGKTNPSCEKSFAFSLKIITIFQKLQSEKREYVLSKQLLRSGTSIGANVEEANGAYSKADFAAKMSIAYKEARETHYWLRLLRDSNILSETDCSALLSDCEELQRILGSIVKSARS